MVWKIQLCLIGKWDEYLRRSPKCSSKTMELGLQKTNQWREAQGSCGDAHALKESAYWVYWEETKHSRSKVFLGIANHVDRVSLHPHKMNTMGTSTWAHIHTCTHTHTQSLIPYILTLWRRQLYLVLKELMRIT